MSNQIYLNIPDNQNIDNEPNWEEKSIMNLFKELNSLIFPINLSFSGFQDVVVYGRRNNYIYWGCNVSLIEKYENKLKTYVDVEDKCLKDKMIIMYGDEEKVEKITKLLCSNYKQWYRGEK